MFAYREIVLAATILSTSVVLADVLVQPGYHYVYNRPQPGVPQQPVLPVERNAKQLSDQQSSDISRPRTVQTVYPYYGYQNQNYDQSYVMGYPMYHRRPYVNHMPHHLHYTKLGGRGYVRPSVYLGYPVGHRLRRSVHDAPVEEVNKSAVVKHDDGVATKPSIMDTKSSTAIDPHLQKDKSTDTDNKRSEGKRQTKDAGPLLFGLYPENMRRGSRQTNSNPPLNSGPNTLHLKSTVNPTTMVEQKTTLTNSQGTGQENQKANGDPQSFTNSNQPSTSSSSSNRASDAESALVGAPNYNYYGITYGNEYGWPITSPEMYSPIYSPVQYGTWNVPGLYPTTYARNFPDPRPSHDSWKLNPQYQQYASQESDKKPSLKARNNEQSQTNQLLGASNPESNYRSATSCNSPSYLESSIYDYVVPSAPYNTYDPIPLSYSIDPNYYATYDSGAQSKPVADVAQISPYVLQVLQLLSNYNNPMNTRYVTLPQTYYPNLTYGNVPFGSTFSSPTYY